MDKDARWSEVAFLAVIVVAATLMCVGIASAVKYRQHQDCVDAGREFRDGICYPPKKPVCPETFQPDGRTTEHGD